MILLRRDAGDHHAVELPSRAFARLLERLDRCPCLSLANPGDPYAQMCAPSRLQSTSAPNAAPPCASWLQPADSA